jgi:hypothetical protein
MSIKDSTRDAAVMRVGYIDLYIPPDRPEETLLLNPAPQNPSSTWNPVSEWQSKIISFYPILI